jgi:hypothetical protein
MDNMKMIPLVLESMKVKELTGQEHLIFTHGRLDFDQIYYYRESFDEEGNSEAFTLVYLYTGISICVALTFSEFDDLYLEYRKETTSKPLKEDDQII